MDDVVRVKVDRLTLANLADGLAENQFEAALSEFLAILREHESALDGGGSHATSGGKLTSRITVEVQLTHDIERGRTEANVQVKAKHPDRKSAVQAVRIRDDDFLVEADDNQPVLINRKPRIGKE